MSVGPLSSVPGSAAGSQLPQVKGTDIERASQDVANQDRQIKSDQKAQDAAGIGATEEDQETSDRDADGRRLWERRQSQQEAEGSTDEAEQKKSKDTSGTSGSQLDLFG